MLQFEFTVYEITFSYTDIIIQQTTVHLRSNCFLETYRVMYLDVSFETTQTTAKMLSLYLYFS